MIREERELLTELARLNRDVALLCMRIIGRSVNFLHVHASTVLIFRTALAKS